MWKSEHCTKWKGIVFPVDIHFAFVLHHTTECATAVVT